MAFLDACQSLGFRVYIPEPRHSTVNSLLRCQVAQYIKRRLTVPTRSTRFSDGVILKVVLGL